MALPGDTLVGPPYSPAPFDEPDDILRSPLTQDYELGGTALNNPSQGLQVQNWKFSYVGSDVVVSPDPYSSSTVLFTRAGITQLSGTFDQNMNAAVTFIDGAGAWIWFFDITLNAMTFLALPVGTRTPFLTMDDKRPTANSYNDMLLFFILNGDLVYRQQRNRFGVQRVLHSFNSTDVDILRCGMNKGLRIQIETSEIGGTPLIGGFSNGFSLGFGP
jgi:hypothetical protein